MPTEYPTVNQTGKAPIRTYPNNDRGYGQTSNGNGERWNASMGITFPEYINRKHPNKDPAERFLYTGKIPSQCADCYATGRYIEYDTETNRTKIVHEICEDCRENNLKVMNIEYACFKAQKNKNNNNHD